MGVKTRPHAWQKAEIFTSSVTPPVFATSGWAMLMAPASAMATKSNKLPARYHANVDTIDAPLDRKPGDRPALTKAEMDDVIAFLKTLTDGYVAGSRPDNP